VRRLLFILILALLLPKSASAEVFTLNIMTDLGGSLGKRMKLIEFLRAEKIPVRVIGTCRSSCLWILTLPREQICFAAGAWLGNHTHIGEPDDTIAWRRGRDMIADGYRECDKAR
jgi:hypothetical protein